MCAHAHTRARVRACVHACMCVCVCVCREKDSEREREREREAESFHFGNVSYSICSPHFTIFNHWLVRTDDDVWSPSEIIFEWQHWVACIHHHLSEADQWILHQEPEGILKNNFFFSLSNKVIFLPISSNSQESPSPPPPHPIQTYQKNPNLITLHHVLSADHPCAG